MGRQDLHELMTALRASIARLAESRTADERTLTRALAHLWSAHDELELLSDERLAPRVS
ncbi:MAG TPA: hypothetical protein VF945_14485 [Polyangia bacterium]